MHQCPRCGYEPKPYMMASDNTGEGPTVLEMWNGEGEMWQWALLRAAAVAAVFIGLLVWFMAHQ